MRNTCSWIIRSLVVSVSISTAARAADIGEKAPSLKGVKQWINGDAVEPASGDGKTIYVVEFWATWCGPCRVTIPHLNKLQEQLKDRNVVIVGVTTEDENTVRPFVNELKMGYLVALDTDKTTEQTWMKDVEGIPHAFVVGKDGRILWSGHPMDGLDAVLNDVLEGRFDPEKLKARRDNEAQLMSFLQAGDFSKASQTLDRLLADDSKNMELSQMKAGLLFQTGDFAGLKAHYQGMLKTFDDSAQDLNQLAWMLVAPSPMPLGARDIGVAWAAARRAALLSERKDASILDTLALVLLNLGLTDDAIATQEEAIRKSTDAGEQAELKRTLDYFKDVKRTAADAARELDTNKETP